MERGQATKFVRQLLLTVMKQKGGSGFITVPEE